MKKILITGAGSYIGMSFEKWMAQYDEYVIDMVSTINDEWKMKDFSGYDVVFHVAGIAHVDANRSPLYRIGRNKKTSDKMESLYYKVNRDLTIEVAKKAKAENVKQFIFMSSIIVYGEKDSIEKVHYITKDTVPTPSNYYGMSKLMAEQGILPLQSEEFNVVVLRPPMIYGKDSKGNYTKLAKLARICPVFPDIKNKRSILYVSNLCEFVRLMVDNEEKGIFFPQNKEYVSTMQLVHEIGKVNGKKVFYTRFLNTFVWVSCAIPTFKRLFSKVYGSMLYDKKISIYKSEYRVYSLKESIKLTESKYG